MYNMEKCSVIIIILLTLKPPHGLVCQRLLLKMFTNSPTKKAPGSNCGEDSRDWVKKPRNGRVRFVVDTKAAKID